MPRPCSVCTRADRAAIDQALLDGGAGYRAVAERFGISPPAMFRHRKDHLAKVIAGGLSASSTTRGHRDSPPAATNDDRREQVAIDALQQLRAINAACLEVLRKARADGQPLILLRAVDRIARQIDLQAKLLGQIEESAVINVAILPEWHAIRQLVIDALRPHPEARQAVAVALKGASL